LVAIVAAAAAGGGLAVQLPHAAAVLATPAQVSLVVPSGGPATRAGHLALLKSKTYLISNTKARQQPTRSARGGTKPGEIVWLAALLASMCGFALYFGRELAGGMVAPVRHRPMRRA
jgi:hypothetical protein